jgi:hypothetical protein
MENAGDPMRITATAETPGDRTQLEMFPVEEEDSHAW